MFGHKILHKIIKILRILKILKSDHSFPSLLFLFTYSCYKFLLVFVIPVSAELNLKAAAAAVGEKSVEMLHVKDLLAVTGYIRGGCSPLGMKRKFRTFIDETVLLCDFVCISGGQRGIQIKMKPEDLIQACNAVVCDLEL